MKALRLRRAVVLFACVATALAVSAQTRPTPRNDGVERTIGVCQLIENPPVPPGTAANSISTVTAVWGYLQTVEKLSTKELTNDMFSSAKATLVDGAKHGRLEELGGGDFYYHPASGYFSTDRATVLVEMGHHKVKVVVHIKVLAPTEGNDYQNKRLCPKGRRWKISLNPSDRVVATYSLIVPLAARAG